MVAREIGIRSNERSRMLSDILRKIYPVNASQYGLGLPYAPEAWPKPGDEWGWRAGKTIKGSGCFRDRFLYPPKYILDANLKNSGFRFHSKKALKKFILTKFPDEDVDAFFSSFTWDILAKPFELTDNGEGRKTEPGNQSCTSLVMLCIICYKSVGSENGGYGHIRCEAMVNGSICGHVAHIRCALRTPLDDAAGAVIGVDAWYNCQRCGTRTDLVLHAEKILEECEAITCAETLDSVLTVGVCILRGSERSDAQGLLHRFASALLKVRNGEDIWQAQRRIDVLPVPGDDHSNTSHSTDPEDYDEYLVSIDNLLMLSLPSSETPRLNMAETMGELSALLTLGFSSLVDSSTKLQHLTDLSSQLLQSDAALSPEEHSMLKLIQEIPLVSSDFIEAKNLMNQADKFFSNLDVKLARVASLKSEFIVSKELAKKARESPALLRVEEIDRQIASLQAERAQLMGSVEATTSEIAQYTSNQKKVMGILPRIVWEVQAANAEKEEWERKRKRAAELIEQVVAKFAPLEGFSFQPPE